MHLQLFAMPTILLTNILIIKQFIYFFKGKTTMFTREKSKEAEARA